MKKWGLAAAAALIAAFAICLFIVHLPHAARPSPSRSGSGTYRVTARTRLWKLSSRTITGRAGKQARAVAVQSFEDEAAIGAAFETDTPDLLLCSHAKAAQLDSRAVLAGLETDAEVWTQEVSGLEGVGEYFFPLGARVTVLLTDTAKCKAAGLPASWDCLEDLLCLCAELCRSERRSPTRGRLIHCRVPRRAALSRHRLCSRRTGCEFR